MKIMKKTFFISSFLLGLFFSSTYLVSAEIIRNFTAIITVNGDSSILVEEKIRYDFENEEKHGIYRNIPLKNYKDEPTKIKNISVTDENGNPYIFSENISNKELNIKIGDADKLISGVKEYDISYEVFGAIGFFKDFDEIYWNVNGNGWQVQIENSSASIVLPDDVNALSKACYYGYVGENKFCESSESNIFTVKSILNAGEGFTVALSFPKGTVLEPSKFKKIISIIFNNIIFLLPIIVFIVMFFVWRKKGKDPKGYSTIIAQYEPPLRMKPTLVGSLIDGKVDFRDITAGLIYLAEQGFVKINKIDKEWLLGNQDYEIELIKDDILNLEKTEKDILNLFFDNLKAGEKIKISTFKNDMIFPIKVKEIVKNIYQEMEEKGFYEKNPQKVKIPYIITGAVLIFLGGFSILVPCGIIILVFGLLMSKKTKQGAEAKNHILGFKKFLSVTEKDRLEFHNAPDKNPEKFMEFLPYAIALGVEKKWAEQFEGIYIQAPTWYQGNVSSSFVAASFVSDLSNLGQSFVASSGSGGGGGFGGGGGGGGFSGGGGGGGGGGSW